MISNCNIGMAVTIPQPDLVNLYSCSLGDGCKIAAFVEIQKGVILGKNVKVEAFAFIPSGVTIGDGVFIGPHVCFTNDKYPRAVDKDMNLLEADQWITVPTVIMDGASIGANSTIICGITIGKNSIVGAGSVVTKDVAPGSTVYGNPARRR